MKFFPRASSLWDQETDAATLQLMSAAEVQLQSSLNLIERMDVSGALTASPQLWKQFKDTLKNFHYKCSELIKLSSKAEFRSTKFRPHLRIAIGYVGLKWTKAVKLTPRKSAAVLPSVVLPNADIIHINSCLLTRGRVVQHPITQGHLSQARRHGPLMDVGTEEPSCTLP